MRNFVICLLQLITLVSASANNWTQPNSQTPSFTQSYYNNDRITVSWLSLNDSVNDLWVTRYDTNVDTYADRLRGSYAWTIAINESEIRKDTRFILQFLPTDSIYDPTKLPDLPSPPFNIEIINQQGPPNGTIGATSMIPESTVAATSVQRTNATTAPAAPSQSQPQLDAQTPGPSRATTVVLGVAVGMGLLAIVSAIGAFFVIKAHRRRGSVASSMDSVEEKREGPYEVLGNNRQPTELSSKETMVHEIDSPMTPMSHDGKVFELSTTTKRPGLHELPG